MLIISGYRPYAVQKRLFDQQVRAILASSPAMPVARARAEAARFVADPDVYAPHLTGGAIDVALVGRDGGLLDMGNLCEYGDTAHTAASGLTREQRDNRTLLADAMCAAGFANYPFEWWHWSYGDKYWAYLTGNRAIYGSAAPDGLRMRLGPSVERVRRSVWLLYRRLLG